MSFIMMHNIRREAAERQLIAAGNAFIAHQLKETAINAATKACQTPEGRALLRSLISLST